MKCFWPPDYRIKTMVGAVGLFFDFLTYHKSKLAMYAYARSEEKGVFGHSGLGDLSYVQSYYEDQHKLSVSMSDFKNYQFGSLFFKCSNMGLLECNFRLYLQR